MAYQIKLPKSIMPAPGWQVAHVDDHGEHFFGPLHALALAHEIDADPRQPRKPREDEDWDIVGLRYNPHDCGWMIENEDGNFCGLLPPEMSQEAFLKAHAEHPGYCSYRPTPTQEPQP